MSTNYLDDTNPFAFMLFVGAGSILGGLITQILFPRDECPIPAKHTVQLENKTDVNYATDKDESITKSDQSDSDQE